MRDDVSKEVATQKAFKEAMELNVYETTIQHCSLGRRVLQIAYVLFDHVISIECVFK